MFKVRIVVILIMDLKTRWIWTPQLLDLANQFWEVTRELLQNPTNHDFQLLFTSHEQWTIVKYEMEVLRPFWYWTLWMSKWPLVTPCHIITIFNYIIDSMAGTILYLAKTKAQWKQDWILAVKFVWQMLSMYYSAVTSMIRMLLVALHILDSFRTMRSCWKWDIEIDINPEEETLYTT